MNDVVKKAEQFAKAAHDSIGHKRKYTDEPYHVHPERVAKLVASVTSDQDIIAAAWLHDVLEDVAPKNPEYNADAIRQLLGERILRIVLEVSDISQPQDGNRAARKEIDRNHLAKASPEGMTVKLADMIDNMIDISKHDKPFAQVFKREAILILPHLKKGNKELFDRLRKLLGVSASRA